MCRSFFSVPNPSSTPRTLFCRLPRCIANSLHMFCAWGCAGDNGRSWAAGGGDGSAQGGSRGGAAVGAGKKIRLGMGILDMKASHRNIILCLVAIPGPPPLRSLVACGLAGRLKGLFTVPSMNISSRNSSSSSKQQRRQRLPGEMRVRVVGMRFRRCIITAVVTAVT